jgi:redox-sensitive bicupin YhaK (pirin superfamily)
MNTAPAIIRASERFDHDFGWLTAHHTFSFDPQPNPLRNGFRSLRIINDDTVEPMSGFPAHPHRNMEIFTLMLSGEIEHRDSEGNHRLIQPGDFQYMAAGRGVAHSERNLSRTDSAHLIQIWIQPSVADVAPRYEHRTLAGDAAGHLQLLASGDGRNGSIRINQDAQIYQARLETDGSVIPQIAEGRHGWIQVIEGQVTVAGQKFHTGDGLGVSGALELNVHALSAAHILFFNLP